MYLAHIIDQIHNLLNKLKKEISLIIKTGGILKLII